MEIVNFNNNEFNIWCSGLSNSNTRIPNSENNPIGLKTLYLIVKSRKLLFSDDIIEISTKIDNYYTYYINVYDKNVLKNKVGIFDISDNTKLNIIKGKSKLKNFFIFNDDNFVIYNNKLYIIENKKDILIWQRIRKFKEIEKINKNNYDKEII